MGLRGRGIGRACGIDLRGDVPEVVVDHLFQILVMSIGEDIFGQRYRRICCISEWQRRVGIRGCCTIVWLLTDCSGFPTERDFPAMMPP